VNVTAVPTVPVVGPEIETARVSALMVIVVVAVLDAGGVALSVPVTLIVFEPLTL
jgi:hypothetical protein